MNYITKLLGLLLIVLSFSSCEEEEYIKPDIQLTNVYSLGDFTDKGAPFQVNIYREENSLVRYTSTTTLLVFETKDYIDNSTDDIDVDGVITPGEYNISVTAFETLYVDNEISEDETIVEEIKKEYRYTVIGSKSDNTVTMTCTYFTINEDGTETEDGSESFVSVLTEGEEFS